MHDRSAGGQRVGGRTGRRRDDQAVRTLVVDELVVDVQRKLHHPRHRTGVHDDVVQRGRTADVLAVAKHLRIEQEAMFDGVLAVEHRADLRFDLIGRDVGEKPEPAAIDADHRHLRRSQIARDAEQAAVAADDDQQITQIDRVPCALRSDAGTTSAALRPSPFRTTIETLRARRNCSSVATDSTMLRLPLRAISPTVLKASSCGVCDARQR